MSRGQLTPEIVEHKNAYLKAKLDEIDAIDAANRPPGMGTLRDPLPPLRDYGNVIRSKEHREL